MVVGTRVDGWQDYGEGDNLEAWSDSSSFAVDLIQRACYPLGVTVPFENSSLTQETVATPGDDDTDAIPAAEIVPSAVVERIRISRILTSANLSIRTLIPTSSCLTAGMYEYK